MGDQRHPCLLLGTQHRGRRAARLVEILPISVVMNCQQRLDASLHRLGQIVVSGLLVREQGVAADLGHHAGVQRGGTRRDREIRVVGVEIRSGVLQARGLAVLLHIGQDQDVRVLGVMELVDDVRLRRPDAARKLDELRRRDVLPAQRQHLVRVQRPLEFPEGRVGQRQREIDVGGFDTEQRRQRSECNHWEPLLVQAIRQHEPAPRVGTIGARHEAVPLMIADADPVGDMGLENVAR